VPTLTPEKLKQLLLDSKDAAAAFLEDMRHLRAIIATPPPKRSELRRISGILRRLLIDDDLKAVASPRLSPLLVLQPDNKAVYKQLEHNPNGFFGSAGIELGKITLGGLVFVFGHLPPPPPPRPTSTYADACVAVRIDNFLSQRVLYLSGSWATRRAVIKYVANVASGIHTGEPKSKDEMLIEDIRRTIFYVFDPPNVSVRFRSAFFTLNPADFRYDEQEVDPTLIEVYSTAFMLTISPAIAKLEEIVVAELKPS
jgi:hypothetical protein